MNMPSKTSLLALFLLLSLLSCRNDSYESGEGELSRYTAEMTTFSLKNKTQLESATLDDGRTINFSNPRNAETMKTNYSMGRIGDDILRVMAYFIKRSEDEKSVSAEYVNAKQVIIPRIELADTAKMTRTDPVKLKSAWTGSNGEFLNLNFEIMTGTAADGSRMHNVAILCDSVKTAVNPTTKKEEATVYLRFAHSQNNVPQYYSEDIYLSLSRSQIKSVIQSVTKRVGITAFKTNIRVNTFEGEKSVTL